MPSPSTQHPAYKTVIWLCTGLLILDVITATNKCYFDRIFTYSALSRIATSLLGILVLWRPRLIALLVVPVAVGFLGGYATIGFPLFLGAFLATTLFSLRHAIAPVLIIAAIVAPFALGFETNHETIVTALSELIAGTAIGLTTRLVIRSQRRAEDRLQTVTKQNADIRDNERRLLAAELERVVRAEIATCRVAAHTNPVWGINSANQDFQAFETIEKSARTALADLRQLLDALRSPTHVAPLPPPPSRRWWAQPAMWLRLIATGYIGWRLSQHFTSAEQWQYQLVNVLALVVALIALFRWRIAMWLTLGVIATGALLSGTTWTVLKLVSLISFLAGVLRTLSGWRLGLVLLGIPAVGATFFALPYAMQEGAFVHGVLPGAIGYGIGQIMRIRAESVPLLRRLTQARPKIRTDERNTLARELHDVVAHQLSVVALQSMAYAHTVSEEKVTAAKERITAALDTAEAELDLLVGEMSQTGTASGVVLSPRSLVGTLTEQLVANGFVPSLTVAKEVDDLPVSLQRTLSRALQESITNVLRYAPPHSCCSADIQVTDTSVTLTVANPLPYQRLNSDLACGFGLRGIRERVDLQQGTFFAGPELNQWVVRISIPCSVKSSVERTEYHLVS